MDRAQQQTGKQRITYKRPWLYPKQEEAMFYPKDSDGGDARFSWVEASTKSGKTISAIAWLYEMAYCTGGPNKNFWWVAPVFTQSEIAFRRLISFLPQGVASSNKQNMTVHLPNGAVIWFKSADNPETLYGEDVYGAVIDEASRCKQEAWFAVRSTVTATRAPVRGIGNVKGRKNWFYQMARAAEKGNPGHAFYRITAQDAIDAGVLVKEEVEGARGDLPEFVYKELYEAVAADDGGNPFGLKYITACLMPGLSTKRPMVWGWDLAKSVDWTVGIALDEDGKMCRFERFKSDWMLTVERIRTLVRSAPALIDSTGVGDPIVEMLQKTPGSRFEGYQFTSQSKQRLMEGLAVAFQRGEVGIIDGVLRLELESYEYRYTRTGVRYGLPEDFDLEQYGSADAARHDDAVCALALANYHKTVSAPRPLKITKEAMELARKPPRLTSLNIPPPRVRL